MQMSKEMVVKSNESNELLLNSFKDSTIKTIVFDIDTNEVMFANKVFLDFFKYSNKEIIEKKISDICEISIKKRLKIASEAEKKNGNRNNIEIQFVNKLGEQITIKTFVANLMYKKRNCRLFLLSDTSKFPKDLNISAIKSHLNFSNKSAKKNILPNGNAIIHNNDVINFSIQNSKDFIESVYNPLFIINLEGIILEVNEAAIVLTGKPRTKLINSSFINYFTDKNKVRNNFERVFTEGVINSFSLTLKNYQLKEKYFSTAVYKSVEGKVIGAIIMEINTNSHHLLKKKLVEPQEFPQLAATISKEAKIIAGNAIQNAREIVKLKQQFLSNMSHEIRTPVNVITGFTKMLLKTEISAQQREYLMAIKMSVDSLIVLINDILDLAKVNAGKMVFENKPFKLKTSVKNLVKLFEPKIQDKNLELIVNYDNKIPEVISGDAVRLHQIILNLLTNAIKFTNQGSITFTVEQLNENKDSVDIKFYVADTGIGIKENDLEKIFETFQQATNESSKMYGGTGLGLAITKQLVEGQKGKIEVKSEWNKGSVFSFILNFKKTNEEVVSEPEIVDLNSDKKDVKILIVEDMELNQLLMKTMLDDFGFESEIASNGKVAIEKLKEKKYDVILMDLQMPEINGLEATMYIRNNLKLTIPIIALTADVTRIDVSYCKKIGMNDYISKPIDEQLLYNKLIRIIEKPNLNLEDKIYGNKKVEKLKHSDLSYLTRVTKSNPKLMSEIIATYLKQTPLLVNTMKQSFLDKNWDLLKSTLHKMMPSFSVIGLNPEIIEIANTIQDYNPDKEKEDDLEKMILDIENACRIACNELELELITLK